MRNRLSSAQHVNTAWLVVYNCMVGGDYNSITLAGRSSGYTTHQLKNGTPCTRCSAFKLMRNRLSSGQHVSTALLVDQSKYATEWWDYNSISLAITTSGYTTHELKNGIR